jgi:hypothetical protein
MSGGYASKRNMANGRGIPYPAPVQTDWSGNKIRKQTKMRISFRQRFRNWLFEENDSPDMVVSDSDSPNFMQEDNCIRFEVVSAAGGRIVQVRHYDRVKDRNLTSLHIITPDEDLPTALAHILALTTLGK